MIEELNALNAADYLERRRIALIAPRVSELGGGVSNTVLLVESNGHRFVLKQSLPKLRVAQEWLAGRDRIFRESAALQKLSPYLPENSLPKVLFEDRDNFTFAMTAAPVTAVSWKDQLLAGEIELDIARQVGALLARIVTVSWHSLPWEQEFGDQTIFDQLRIDPYYRATARKHPDLAPHAARLIEESAARRISLTHGDWSPKNFLVTGPQVMAIDFEVIHYGDPSFDSAFLLNHLLLKSFYRPQWAKQYADAAAAFWQAFVSGIPDATWIEPATLQHLGWLLLARIDGKSPAEYIRDPQLQEKVRRFARNLILSPPSLSRRSFQLTMKITSIRALEILDSRGNPTLSVQVELDSSIWGQAQVPSGASTGKHEAVELRDGDPSRYAGKGVSSAVSNVEHHIAPALKGMDAANQAAVDQRLIALDGTEDKSKLGANAILGVSCAVSRAAAAAERVPLWVRIAGRRKATIPMPMVNILSGGLHAGRNFEFQDFLAVPRGFPRFSDALEAVVAIHHSTRALLEKEGHILTGVADEGGWGPRLKNNEAALDILTRAIAAAGFAPGEQVSIAIDAASTHFYANGQYNLENRSLSSEEMVGLLSDWVNRYPIISIEDGLAEDDWDGWAHLTAELGSRVQLVGDDLFTTNRKRLDRGIGSAVANAVLVKMNQIGTLTETLDVVDRARAAGYRAVISARSGETEDAFLADLAVASGAGQIKVGSITRSERLAKYNRLLEIEKWDGLPYAGGNP